MDTKNRTTSRILLTRRQSPVRNDWLFGISVSYTYCATFFKNYQDVKSKFTFISCKIFFSNLETCTCEIPNRSATSDCV